MKETLGNENWVRANEHGLRKLLPETWTNMQNVSLLKIGFGLKLLGVDWRSEQDLPKIMVWFEKTGIMLRDKFLVRANPVSIFSNEKFLN